MEIKAYKNYNGEIEVDKDTVIVSLWNSYIEAAGEEGNKISFNNADFFNRTFKNPYDAVMAVSLSGKWSWTDDFVCFDEEGYLTSFSHWDDVNSPINLNELDIGQLINSLKKWHKKRYVVNNIPRAIHDALK